MQPFLDQYLKDGAAKADTAPVLFYQTGSNRRQRQRDRAAGGAQHGAVSARRRA
ncbi:hypothetical protein [Rugamonas sp. DEMB1]|uniref:hypothetical protein n=1 Tax=Rugamonas sp. DEMB1 TaxID=3039386 RepID=UPI002449FC21|nr:hypothetical protein [Rugamonas sp. DEMB1]WGG52515.1 hypothetical protein QC826_10425 [Rugamonas sp. DEMB1]